MGEKFFAPSSNIDYLCRKTYIRDEEVLYILFFGIVLSDTFFMQR